MADTLLVPLTLVGAAVRLPDTTQENQVVTNEGPGPAYLAQTAAAATPVTGLPFPVGSVMRLIKNGLPVYGCAGLGNTWSGAPSLPASGTAATNSSGQAVAVTISGGTVSAIAVNGVTQSVNGTDTTAGTFIVPAGQTITVTYSGAPTTYLWQFGQPVNLAMSAGVQAT